MMQIRHQIRTAILCILVNFAAVLPSIDLCDRFVAIWILSPMMIIRQVHGELDPLE